jgi:hypothetical protein
MSSATALPQTFAQFDYALLAPDAAAIARNAANAIRSSLQTHIATAIEVGKQLSATKEALGHGQFLAWLAAEIPFSERSAQRYMRAAEVYGAKSDTVSDLPLGLLYQLQSPSVPEDCRKQIINRRESGERLGESDIEQIVSTVKREAKEAKRKAAEEAKLTPAAKARRKAAWKKRQVERERHQAEWDERELRRKEAIRLAATLIIEQFGSQRLVELRALLKQARFLGELCDALEKANPEAAEAGVIIRGAA